MRSFTALVMTLAVAALFALMSGCSTVRRAAAVRGRHIAIAAALVATTAGAWTLMSPLAAAAVPLIFAALAAALVPGGATELADYATASDRARSADPPWWPEFEHEFRRECRRRERMRRRSSHRSPPAKRRA